MRYRPLFNVSPPIIIGGATRLWDFTDRNISIKIRQKTFQLVSEPSISLKVIKHRRRIKISASTGKAIGNLCVQRLEFGYCYF